MSSQAIAQQLLTWFAKNARDLPWRKTTDPYAIWVSEVMLQQTQVQTVIPYWERWMRELPNIASLAAAKVEQVLKLWEGLGYYSRARNLQRAARWITEEGGSEFPRDYKAVLGLPGIGRYTAGAICSIAFDEPKAVVDGNVTRVLARVHGIAGDVRTGPNQRQLWTAAQELVLAAADFRGTFSRPCSSLNQALMELGALLCRPKQPLCLVCPLQPNCVAFHQGLVDRLPELGPRPLGESKSYTAFVAVWQQKVLVRRRPANVVNGQLWEFPNVEVSAETTAGAEHLARNHLGASPNSVARLATIKHSITRFRIRVDAYLLELKTKPPLRKGAGVWKTASQLHRLAFPSAHRKILARVLEALDVASHERRRPRTTKQAVAPTKRRPAK